MSSRRGGTSTRATKKPIVIVARESANDRGVLQCFLEAFCPQMQGRIVFLNDKVPLRDASETTLNERVRRFALLARARAARESDALAIAKHIVARGKHTAQVGGNRSYEAFRTDAIDRCRELIDIRTARRSVEGCCRC